MSKDRGHNASSLILLFHKVTLRVSRANLTFSLFFSYFLAMIFRVLLSNISLPLLNTQTVQGPRLFYSSLLLPLSDLGCLFLTGENSTNVLIHKTYILVQLVP